MENPIESSPKIVFGKPVIKGTRITVELILGKIAAGDSVETILSSYPHQRHVGKGEESVSKLR